MQILPGTGALGADIAGFTPADAESATGIAWLIGTLRQHPVLRLRGAAWTDAAQIALSTGLRALTGADPAAMLPGAVLRVTNLAAPDGAPLGVLGDGEVSWHSDGWFREQPFAVATLRALVVPPAGGGTHFSDMTAALDTLPAALRAAITGQAIHHQTVYTEAGPLRQGMTHPPSPDIRTWAGVDHPVIRRPALADRPCLYLGRRKQASVIGLPPDASDALLDALWQHATRPALVWTQRWQTGDLLIWDNRRVLHRRDAFDPASVGSRHRTGRIARLAARVGNIRV